MLGLGLAMQTTGTADLIAGGLAAAADFDFISAAARPYAFRTSPKRACR